MQIVQPNWEEIIEAAGWSDEFIRYRPAKAAKGPRRLLRAARAFLTAHPHCPFDVDWLVRQFSRNFRGGFYHGRNPQ